MLPILLIACGSDLQCADGTHQVDSTCVADVVDDSAAPGFVDLHFPPCESTTGTGTVSLDAACVDGLCVGDTYNSLVATLGPPDGCHEPCEGCRVYCDWDTLGLSFGVDGGETPPAGDAPVLDIWLGPPYAGSTSDGLGVGVSLDCFLDALGPASLYLDQEGTEYPGIFVSWRDPNVMVFDNDGGFDGFVESIAVEAVRP